MKILNFLAAVLFFAYCSGSAGAGEPPLEGKWHAENSFHYIGALFDYSFYEKYKTNGFRLFNSGKSDSFPDSDNLSGKDYSVLELKNDGQFEAKDALFREIDETETRTYSTRWTGNWTLLGSSLCLTVFSVNTEGRKIFDEQNEILNKTFCFVYEFKDSALLLFPVFNKDEAYEIMSANIKKYETSPVLLADLGDSFTAILSNSDSTLTAYSVKTLLCIMDDLKKNPSKPEEKIAQIKNILKMWHEGSSGLPVKKTHEEKLSKSAIEKKWHLNAALDDFLNLIVPEKQYGTQEAVLIKKYSAPSFKRASDKRFELDLGKNSVIRLRSTVFTPHPTKPEYEQTSEEFKGTWTLEGNIVKADFSELTRTHMGGAYRQDFQFKASFRVKVKDKKLYVSKNMPSEEGFLALTRMISAAPETIAIKELEGIPDLLNNEYSILGAYDIYKMKTLIKDFIAARVNNDEAKRLNAFNKIANLLNKWHKGFQEYNK
jgi:hypothetical protein